ncbi:hypothetical protein ES708_21349 [subsurface metagenome]
MYPIDNSHLLRIETGLIVGQKSYFFFEIQGNQNTILAYDHPP